VTELLPGGKLWADRASRWGIVLLALAAATYLVTPPSWPAIVLAAAAWTLLSRGPTLGPLPAAAAIVLALPYDRAADADLLRLASIPVRPHDVVIGLALAASLPGLRRLRWSPAVRLLLIMLVVGAGALALGLLIGHPLRDILRDARWWGLYAGGVLWAGMGPRPGPLLRAIFLGLAIFCLLLVATTLVPGVEGGLKQRAMAFDLGVLRLHFGPTTFLLIPIAYWTARLVTTDRWVPAALALGLSAVGLGLSITRVTSVVLFAVIGLVIVGVAARTRTPRLARRWLRPLAVAAAGLVLALGVDAVGVQIPHLAELTGSVGPSAAPTATAIPTATPSPTPGPIVEATPAPTPTHRPTGPLARFPLDVRQLLAALTDRFQSYQNATTLIAASPIVGHGMGVLVDVDYEFGAGEFNTEYRLPNVDNAYLTIAMKAGVFGVIAFVALFAWPLWRLLRTASRRAGRFLLPAWIGLLLLTFTQGFAVIGHSPFLLGLLIVAIDLLPRRPASD
jgi:O-Antigen ligase